MARIRTIKPEFPQSESMGRVSRDARLLFIQLWTQADDAGRLRGNSQMLSSLLYPYDDDAKDLIDGWLDDLQNQECIVRYSHLGNSYIEISNWTEHQKIDKPSPSKFPSPNGDEAATRNTERDLEISLVASIQFSRMIFGLDVIDIQRQVRVENCYLDIVVTTLKGKFILEIKRDSVTVSDLSQVERYKSLTGGNAVLVGRGISPQFPIDRCKQSDVAVALVKEGSLTLAIPSSTVTECSIILSNVE